MTDVFINEAITLEAKARALSRDEYRAQRLLAKDVARALKQMARGTGWRFADRCLFREHHGSLVYSVPHVSLVKHRRTAQLSIKPLGIDPIFWDIVDLPENNQLPLSFRIFGAWTCSMPPLLETAIPPDHSEADAIAAFVFRWASLQLSEMGTEWTAKRFLNFVQNHPRQKEVAPWLATEIATLILLNDEEAAKSRCDEARARNWQGGFTVDGTRSFVDLASDWLDRQSAARMRH